MSEDGFVDYFELLQLCSNADTDTIERVFSHLAKYATILPQKSGN
jgi:hypothetical protein